MIARHRYYRGEPQEDVEAYADWLSSRISGGTYVGFVADVRGDVVAGAGAVLLDWGPTRGERSSTRARIANVFTDAPWRLQGLARSLVTLVMQACTDRGVRVYNLAASSEGLALYGSLGFVPYEGEMILRP